jgi:hypothetical protein
MGESARGALSKQIALNNCRNHLVNPFDKFFAAALERRRPTTAFRSTARRMRVRLHFDVVSRSGAVFQLRSGGALLGLARCRRGDELVVTGTLFARIGRRL